MGVLTEYYRVADDASALRALTNGPVAASLPTVELKNIDPVVLLGHLVALARAVDWSPGLTDTALISPSNSDGPWVNSIGNGIRDTLADIAESDFERLATNWATAEEFGGMASTEGCAAVIADLVWLAREAVSSKQRLFCWISL